MALTLKPDDQEIRHHRCKCCQEPIERVWNHVYRDSTAKAVLGCRITDNDQTLSVHLA